MLLPISIFAQSTVSGTVVDNSGMPIPGVNIAVKNTNKGTTTDFDGNYSIVLENGETLSFSYIGYRTQNIVFNGNNTSIDVSMVADAAQLDEVVLIGYGSTTKQDATGAVG
jgi:iron complex outermembrane receptor protein